MSDVERDEEGTSRQASPWSRDAGPEPAWAEAIRQGRKARGDRLRAVFASFGDEGSPPEPAGDDEAS